MEGTRVLVDGTFDLFSLKHMDILKRLKESGYIVVIGVYSDEEIRNLNLTTVMTELERVETLKHSRYVDHIIFPSPYIVNPLFLQENSISTVFGDALDERYELVTENFKLITNSQGADADEIISRVLDQLDEYCERNYSRGYSYESMGLNTKEATCMLLRLAHKKRLN